MRAVLVRLVRLVLTLTVATIAIWSITYALPGDPAAVQLGANASPESLAAERERMRLGDPPPVRYLVWLGGILHGDLGTSFSSRADVGELIASRLPPSLQLIGISLVAGALIAVPVAVGQVRGRPLTRGLLALYSGLALGVPTFWVGLLLILAFAVRLDVLPPTASYIPIHTDPPAALKAIALPVATLAIFCSGVFSRFLRAGLAEQFASDHVRTAEAKGLSSRRVTWVHALHNAMPDFVTVAGLQVSGFVGGALVTEQIFNYPGLGRLLLTAATRRDYPLLQGILLFVVVTVILTNSLADAVRSRLDPRIRS